MPRFSVIIPTFNRASLLKETLNSVFAQQIADYELIVVDDGSTDNTAEILRNHGSRLRTFEQSNRGPGAARNLGVKHANGDYLAFLDSDDVWFPWTLAAYAECVQQCNSAAFIAGKPKRFSNETQLRPVERTLLEVNSFPDYLSSGDEWRWWGASSFVIRKDAFTGAGGFRVERINGEDADLALRLGDAGSFVQIREPFTFGYREHENSEVSDLSKTVAGARHKINSENRHEYPGGEERAKQRWQILTRHIRPVSFACLQRNLKREAWELYRATFRWHLALGRWRYLTAFPLKAFSSQV